MKIQYYIKHVYGQELTYIFDLTTATIINNLTHKKTVDKNDLDCLKNLGHTLEQVLCPKL
jgi:hypothetical protein